jgi:uncharacterized membrane protein
MPFLYSTSSLSQLPLLPGMSRGDALDVNDQGNIVGFQQDHSQSQERAVVWISGVPIDLGFANSDALAINNLAVVGAVRNDVHTRTFFLWQNGQVSDLFSAQGGRFYDMNDAGGAVGSVIYGANQFAFLWDPL